MKLKIIIILLLSFLILSTSCDKDRNNNEIKEISLNTKEKSFIQSGNTFSFNLLKKISEAETDVNFMISPISINYALAMTANGAANNTLSEMLASMGFETSEITEFNEYFKFLMEELTNLDSEIEFNIANSIWYDENFSVLQSFKDINQEYYDAEIEALDFASSQAPDIINNWVSDATNGKIEEIVNEVDPSTVMFLINAIYFLGDWKYEFDLSETQDRNFYLNNNEPIQVPSMKMEATLKYFSSGNAQVVELPYGRGNFVMDVIIPTSEHTTDDIIQSLSSDTWIEWTNGFYETAVLFSMPKFEFEYEKELKEILQSLGMIDLFYPSTADLSNIGGIGGLFVSKVKHKTYIKVDEVGTEAAAVTSVEVMNTSVGADTPIVVHANKPFVFLIREVSTGAILFSGVIANPIE